MNIKGKIKKLSDAEDFVSTLFAREMEKQQTHLLINWTDSLKDYCDKFAPLERLSFPKQLEVLELFYI